VDATQADAVYELAARGFAELGASDPQCISRSFLLKNVLYAGQVFRCERWQAVWMSDGETVEFFDAAGRLVRTLSLVTEVARKAA
jgi:hypothetical protein